jgi:uncharacterized protein (DUF1501 family)
MSHRHCTEYARAGAGLPAIERGMPAPAGTGLSRRTFLLRTAGLAMSVYGAPRLAPEAIGEGIAHAADYTGPTLVNVFFSGGLDSIGVLGQYGNGRYHDLRENLADVDGVIAFDGAPGWSWHPHAAGLHRLWESDRLTLLPSVGYDDANQSHFTSRHFWEIGATDIQTRTGWLGRYLDIEGVGDLVNPLQGLTLGPSLMPGLATARVPVAAVEDPQHYVFRSNGLWELEPKMHEALAALAEAPSGGDPVLTQARAAQANASNLQDALAELPGERRDVSYPATPFAGRLRHLADMLEHRLPIRCASLIVNGDYDTHAGQAAGFANHLPPALQALEVFQADLEDRGIADRVLTFGWSEFGRRPEENGSGGTDHGASAMAFLMGTAAAPSVIGAMPDIAANALDANGNIRHDLDFRSVYGSLTAQWLGGDAEQVVPGYATDLPILATTQ